MEDDVDEPKTTIEELIEVSLHEKDPEKKVLVGTLLKKEDEEELANFLRKNRDIFAWTHKDLPGINPSKVEHCLNIDPNFPPIRPKKKGSL